MDRFADTDQLVSIVMAAKNSGPYIESAIKSVLSQEYPIWELLVIDDHSQDQTASIIKDIAATDARVQYCQTGPRSRGTAAARNLGIRNARGRYIAFLDSDDLWHPRKLSVQLAAMTERKAVLCYCAYRKLYDDGSVGDRAIEVPKRITYSELLKSNVIGCSTAVFDARTTGKILMPEVEGESAHYFEDYAMWLRIARECEDNGLHLVGINEALVTYRVHKGSTSSNKWRAAQYTWRVYRRVEGMSLPTAAYHFGHYAIRGLNKYLIR